MSNSYSHSCMRIGLCSDTHYWPGGTNTLTPAGGLQLQQHSQQLQASLLSELKAADVDLVIHLGDLTCGGGSFGMPREKFLQSLLETHAGFNSLSMPTYALPGNHDCLPGGNDWALFEKLWQLDSGLGRTIDTPHARLILLNAQGHSVDQIDPTFPHDPVYGWINESEMARLEADLASSDGRPIFVFIHQLLLPWTGTQPWKDFYGVKNAAAVRSILHSCRDVQAIFQGHAHRLNVQKIWQNMSPFTYVVTPSIVEYPVSWLMLTVTSEMLEVKMMPLPLPDLRSRSMNSGQGQHWRDGEPEWQSFTIPLLEMDLSY